MGGRFKDLHRARVHIRRSHAMPRRVATHAFTLIELLVVIAIIAVLIGILLPSLGAARKSAWTLRAGANLRSVGQAVATYVADNDVYPPSYVYAAEEYGGDWNVDDQLQNNPTPVNGYVHWSWALFGGSAEGGGIAEEAFTSPGVTNGGAPRTNPGEDPEDWEPGQQNDLGQDCCAEKPKDRQAKRMAFTGNGAIFPRNKFSVGSPRQNRLASGGEVDSTRYGPAKMILATEFYDNRDAWTSLVDADDNKIKSHRPVLPFLGKSAGIDVYNEPPFGSIPRFRYPEEYEILEDNQLGANMINNPNSPLNAVGRHHSNGKTNFLFVDGHVDLMKLKETVRLRLWGDRFYCITGKNEVDLEFGEF
jgi:prepilin-type N-terminal cleavage/methylation domain-containing protein/prepilin-type processing-associated H-X9-DG protein